MTRYVYMKCTNDKYELPVAIADSPSELARLTGTTKNRVCSAIWHKQKTYVKVDIGYEQTEEN